MPGGRLVLGSQDIHTDIQDTQFIPIYRLDIYIQDTTEQDISIQNIQNRVSNTF